MPKTSQIDIKHFGPRPKSVKLSVLVPTYRDDPSELLRALLVQADKSVEILIYDDGSDAPDIATSMREAASEATSPVSLLFAHKNAGRSTARNRLTEHAKGKWLLFLDADMMPTDEFFLSRYMEHITSGKYDVLFGGFEMPEAVAPEFELHRAFSASSDCLSAEERNAKGAQYVCSSNLAVRADVLAAESFDTGFTGWGWEDSEWAARIAKSYKLFHIDNAAMHLGLESDDSLLRRFANSGANYDRFVSKHPELAKSLTLYKMMRTLARIPGQTLFQTLYKMLVKARFLPSKIRLLALKFWRASHYAQSCASAKAQPQKQSQTQIRETRS